MSSNDKVRLFPLLTQSWPTKYHTVGQPAAKETPSPPKTAVLYVQEEPLSSTRGLNLAERTNLIRGKGGKKSKKIPDKLRPPHNHATGVCVVMPPRYRERNLRRDSAEVLRRRCLPMSVSTLLNTTPRRRQHAGSNMGPWHPCQRQRSDTTSAYVPVSMRFR